MFHGCGDGVDKGLQLPALVVPPRGIAGFGDPDLGLHPIPIQNPPDLGQDCLPAVPVKFPCAGEAMHSHSIDILHHTTLAYEGKPVRICWTHAGEHCLLAAVLCPVCGAADHLSEDPPLWVQSPIPI